MKNQLHELAHSIYAPMFAEKDTLKDAFLYAHELARASNDSTAVFTALFVVCNTIAKEIESIANRDTNIHQQMRAYGNGVLDGYNTGSENNPYDPELSPKERHAYRIGYDYGVALFCQDKEVGVK